jgi:GNAT superfamily N-acetyltransferase
LPTITVRPFVPNDLPAAAALLAARHKRDRQRLNALEPALEDPAACAALLAPLPPDTRADGVVALIDGRVAAFLFGERMTLPPTDFSSLFIPPQSIAISVQGHAAEPGPDLFPLYRAMYGELAARWVRSGFFQHQTHIFAGDPELQEAWVALGFGRMMTAAIRPVADPVATQTTSRTVDVRRATDEDLDVVMGLGDTLLRFHSLSPMFWPFLAEPQPATREFQRMMLTADENGYFVAYDGGQAVAMQTFLRHGFLPAITPQERNTYLFEGIVEPGVRGGGLGTELLARGLAWAREQGDEYCTLHFASGNPSGAPFWLGHGFVPVEYTMTRRVDERVAWANGWT